MAIHNPDGTIGTGTQRVMCANALCPNKGGPLRRSPSQIRERNYCDMDCRDADKNKPQRKRRFDTGIRKSPYVAETCGYVDCERKDVLVERRVTDARRRLFHDRSCASKQARLEGRIGRPRQRDVSSTYVTKDGYITVFVGVDHPMAYASGYIQQHRLVMAEIIGRPLLPNENVHHINGNRQDNRPENLELWVKSQPSGQRAIDLLDWAREIVARYEPFEQWLRSVA